MITPETIADIRAALDVATRGPWKCLDRRAGNLTAGYSVWQDLERPYADSPYGKQVCLTPDGSQPSNRKNMELIAMLHNHAAALLDEIERLRARVAELEEKLRTEEADAAPAKQPERRQHGRNDYGMAEPRPRGAVLHPLWMPHDNRVAGDDSRHRRRHGRR